MAADRPITAPDFAAHKARGEKLTMVTAYDFTFARLADDSVEAVLVGDSLGMVVKGQPHPLEVTLDEAIYHSRCVSRGLSRAMLIADLPFMTYQVSDEQALVSAGRLVQDGGAQAVKLEGGERSAGAIRRIVEAGIPVMGHVGLTPQSVHQFGGFKVQRQRERLLQGAKAVADAGAFAVVLECVPAEYAAAATRELAIPTIGVGAGPDCDGQVLVLQDVLGLGGVVEPRFVKRFAELGEATRAALAAFRGAVRGGDFPGPEHSFKGD